MSLKRSKKADLPPLILSDMLFPNSIPLQSVGAIPERIGSEQGYLKLSDLEKVKHEEKMPLADHRSALLRVIEILSKNGRFDCKAILHPEIDPKLNEQHGKQSNGRISSGSGLLCLVIPTNEELMIARETDRLTP